MLTHSKVKKQCDWSLFFILTHIVVSKRWSTSICSDEYWVVTASPNTSALLVHPWHHDNCFCLPATVIMTKLLCQSSDCRWLVFFTHQKQHEATYLCVCVHVCVKPWLLDCVLYCKVTNVSHKADNLLSAAALLVNEVRELQSTQSTLHHQQEQTGTPERSHHCDCYPLPHPTVPVHQIQLKLSTTSFRRSTCAARWQFSRFQIQLLSINSI